MNYYSIQTRRGGTASPMSLMGKYMPRPRGELTLCGRKSNIAGCCQEDDIVLFERYANDGEPVRSLGESQREALRKVEAKVKDGTYVFESVPCSTCGKSDFEVLSEKDRYGLYMPVVACRTCGLVQTNPRMDQKSYNEFYDSEYRTLYGDNHDDKEGFFQRQRDHGEKIFRLLETNGLLPGPPTGLRVLEVGCEAGGILDYFKVRGAEVKWMDLGSDYLEFGRTTHGLDLSLGSLGSLGPEVKFDIVIYSDAIEHILDIRAEMERLAGLLSDRGLLYIEATSLGDLMNCYEMDYLKFMQNAHVYHFSARSLRNLLESGEFKQVAGGFELIRCSGALSAVFRKSGRVLEGGVVSEYPAIVDYLRRVEALRLKLPVPPYFFRLKLLDVLRKAGAYGLVNSLLNLFSQVKRV